MHSLRTGCCVRAVGCDRGRQASHPLTAAGWGDGSGADLYSRQPARDPRSYRQFLPLDDLNDDNACMDDPFLEVAISEARKGANEGGIPIGSVIVYRDKIIGRGHNRRVQRGSAILHGEMDAFENAGRQPASVYRECVLYTTLSPCSMCSGAILLYGVPRVIVGENRTFIGEEELLRSRGVSVEVLQNEECIRLMKEFIQQNAKLWNEDIGV
jgi:cytosine deaminase